MNQMDPLKRKLCAALDDLSDDDGFVLVATADDISFTLLKAAGWNEDRVLELEPLNVAVAAKDLRRLRDAIGSAERRHEALTAEIAAKETRLADVNTALENALGGKS